MKYLFTKGKVKDFYIYKNQEIFVFDDKLQIGNQVLDSIPKYSYFVQNDNLERVFFTEDHREEYFLYQDGQFVAQDCRYGDNFTFLSSTQKLSSKFDDGKINVSLIDGTQEVLFDINAESDLGISKIINKHSIMIFPMNDKKSLLFYTKTGQRLWKYKEEDESLKINGRCIPVVDDVVVVISLYGARPKKIQGFNIRTGERLWINQSEAKYEPDTFHIGADKMLYGCRGYVVSPGIGITKLNPLTGELEVSLINKDEEFDFMPWNVTMHGRQLYFVDNRRGNEIGVIDVDKKELIERVPLNIKKKVTIGAPVVTDDKVYVFISDLQELRVFEK